jgi:hypothetical protein
MPVSEVRVPDGRVFEISHPEGASKEEIFAFAEYQYLQFEEPPERTMPVAPPVEEEEDTGMLSDIAEFGQRTLGAAGRILGQAPAGLQSMFREGMEEDEELVERNRAIEESIRSGLGYDDEYDDSTLGLAADVTGSVLGFGGTTLAGAALGSVVPGVGTLVGGVLGLGSGILLGAGSNVARGMEEAARQVERGEIVSDADYEKASTRLAAIGASEGLPFIGPTFRVLRRISGAAAKNPKAVETLGDYIRSAALQGTEEAAQEALAGIATDAVLKEYINPDIEIGDSLGIDLVAGGTAGALFDVAINLATRRRRAPTAVDEEIKPFREELIAEEAALRENIESSEEARRERMGELARMPVIPAETGEVILPELLEAGRALVEPSPAEMKVLEKRRTGEELTSAERRILREYKQRVPDADAYNEIARRVVRQMGDQFPVEPEFYLDDQVDGMPGMVAIRDGSGRMYGSPLRADMAPKLQPAVAALNAQTVEENIFQSNRTAIAESKEQYSPDQIQTLQRLGRIALGPESLSYSSEAADYAGGTTVENGFIPHLSAEKALEANIPRSKQTVSQRINIRRLKEGKSPTRRFALSEIRREIGKDVGRLAEYEAGAFDVDTFRALPMPVQGKFAVVPERMNANGVMEASGETLFDRPPTKAERQAAREAGRSIPARVPFQSAQDAANFAREANLAKGGAYIPSQEIMGDPDFSIEKIQELLDGKNISSDINSPEIKALASRFTGNKLRKDQTIGDMTAGERQLFYQKLRQLPRFTSPTKIPLFKLRARPTAEPIVEEQAQTEVLGLPSPAVPQGMDAATKGMLERALESRLRQLGLTDYKTMVTNTLKAVARDADGNVYMRSLPEDQAAGALAEGGISVDGARVIQIAVDNIMARKVKPDDLEAAVVDVLNHEVVHALRELDVITEQELRLLQRLSSRYRKTSTGQTYADWAIETYGDTESDVNIAEEAIAEMIRDAISGRVIIDNKPAVVSGKPRSIINKIIKFFKGLIGVAQDVDPDYTSFTQFMNDLESGQIGARERGPIRTLYRLERGTGQFIDRPAPLRTQRQVETYEIDTPTGRTVIETDSPQAAEGAAEAMGGTATQTARAGDLMEEAGLGDMMLSRRADMKHGIPREYIVSSRGQVSGKPALPKAINPNNGEAQAQKLAELAERHPDPLSSKAAWLKFERDLLGDNETPSAPTGLIDLYNDMDSWVDRHEQLTPEQLTAAGEGFELVEDMSKAYESGDATVDTTGKLMLWGMLSRMLSAHPHESAFLDAAVDRKLSEFIKRATEREWTQADIDEYLEWSDTVIPDFAPSKQGTSNLRAFGKTFLPKMSRRMPSGKSALEELHDLIADKSVPTSDIRAKYYGLNEGMGIQNKVLSFVLLMTGRKDVVILDRIQINSMWDAGRFGKLIYDDVASLFEGAHGLARYEALERSLASRIQGLYDRIGRPEDASVGRYHWESWVRDSGQVVSHPTIKGLIRETREDQPLASSYADIGAPEGRFHQFAFGSVYARDADGTPYIMYADSNGVPYRFGLKRFKDFLDQIKKPASGVIPAKFSVKSYRDAGYPWYQSEEVNRERLDQIIQDFSEGATSTEAAVSDAVKSEAEADVSGQRPRDEDIFGQDRIAFSRRAADRNVEQSSNEAMADVAEYVTETSPDAAGMATIEAGPMAYSINSGFADQNGYAPTFTTPSRSWFQKIVFQVQDKLTDLKSIEDAINENRKARGLRPLKAAESAYTGEETLPGKIGEFDRRFKSNELEPLLKDMADSDVTLDQMDEFLVLRHAVERNDRVRKINPAIPDAGSGKWAGQELTDQYVKNKMLSDFGMKWNDSKGEWEGGNERGRTLSRLASRVDKINSTTLAISRKGELITEQEREFLDGFFKYYTPLRGIAQDEDIAAETDERTAGSGGTLSIVGKEVKRLIGRKTEAISPLATIVTMRGTQAARAVKNTSFGKRLIKLIQENPNNDVWQLISPEDPKYKTAFDSSYTYVGPDRSRYGQKKSDISGESDKKNWVKRVRVVQDPVFNPTGQELLGVKVDGQQYYVFFQNPELRKAAINLDAQSVGYLVEKLNGFTRFMSYVNTSLNPEFVMGNFPRDIETAIFNIVGEQTMEGGKALDAKGIIGQVLKNTIPSVRTFYKGFRNPDSLSAEDATNFREFITSGTKTDWFHSQPPEQQKKNLEMMAEMARGTFKGGAAQGFKAVKDFVDDSNNAVENGVRLATFVAARDAMIKSGMSRSDAIQQASTLAKNLTVNFNRKGNSGQLLNGLYLFFNASVQGTVNTMRGLNVFDPNSSRTKQAVVGSIMGFGALTTAIANALMGEDEFERIPDYIRDRNIIIPDALWGGNPETYSTIPLPYGYNVFWNLGENAYLVSAGQVSPENAAVRATNVFLGSFNPLGTSTSETYLGSLAKTGTPQFLKPVLELVMNENYFGSPIYPPDSPFGGGDDPLSRRSFSNTSQVWKSIAETVGTLTGGNESEPGLIEMPPDALSYLLSFYGGGAGSFAERTFFKVPDALMDPTRDLEVRDIPFVRRIRGEVDNRVDSESFYERRETLQRKDRQANDRLTGAERIAYIKENQDYIKMLPMLQGTEKTLRALRKSLRNLDKLQNVSPQRALEIAEQKRKIQERIDQTIERFNKRYDEVVGKTK